MTIRLGMARALRASLLTLLFVSMGTPAKGADEITIAKDTIRLQVKQRSCFMGDDGCKGSDLVLYPEVSCEWNGVLPSGSQPWVEFRLAGKPAVRMDCAVDRVYGHENRWKVSGGGDRSSKSGFVFPGKIPTGTVDFSLGLKNELTETNTVVYQGTFQFDKSLRNPKDESTAEVFVDDDWRLPIGYLYMSDRGLHVVTCYRGRPGGVKTYLFRNGTEVAQNEGCGIGDVSDFDPTMKVWWEVDCELIGVYGTSDAAESGYDPKFDLSKNPGDYEIKCLAGGKLARVIKFTVKPGGSFDNGIAKANTLGSDRVIVPVEVRLDVPVWNKTAWKTGAFYGHPLTGFSLPE